MKWIDIYPDSHINNVSIYAEPIGFLIIGQYPECHPDADYYIVDFHGEATSEKIAFSFYVDGRVSAVVGTHTHVQTNDDRVLPNKTLYITDLGMTGPLNGVLGVDKDVIVERFLNGYSSRFFTAEGKRQLCGVLLDFTDKNNPKIGKIKIYE